MANAGPEQHLNIDREAIAAIAREVVARLAATFSDATEFPSASPQTAATKTERRAAAITDPVVTADTITRLPSGTSELFVGPQTIVTPAAKDEARTRNLNINRSATPGTDHSSSSEFNVIDSVMPERAEAVRRQLAQRSCRSGSHKIILSDSPASELAHQYRDEGAIACMVGSLEEVDRFSNEIDADVWILDMKRLNLTAAVNVAVRIHRMKDGSPLSRRAPSTDTSPSHASVNKT